MKTKICSKCNLKKSINKFYKKKGGKDGLTRICKACNDIRVANWYKKHHKQKQLFNSNYYKNNKNKVKINASNWARHNPEKVKQNHKNWRHSHKKRIKQLAKRYYKKACLNYMFRINKNLRKAIWQALKNKNQVVIGKH